MTRLRQAAFTFVTRRPGPGQRYPLPSPAFVAQVSGMRKRSLIAWLIYATGSLAVGAPLWAQILPLTMPKSKLRLDFLGQLQSYDYRWNDGTRNETVGDFNRLMDASFVPGLAAAERRVRKITGRNDLSLNLGRSTASQIVNLGTSGFGGAYGLTKAITIHGMVPLIAVKVAPRVLIDSAGSNAGFNPASGAFGTAAGRNQTALFLSSLRAAVAALRTKITAGDYPDPAQRQAADQAVLQGELLATELTGLLQDAGADFAPRDNSQAGQLILAAIAAFRTTLSSLQVSNLNTIPAPAFAGRGLDYQGFENFLTNADGSIGMRPIDEIPALSYLGDIEVGVAVAVIDHFPTNKLGSGFRAVIDGTVRLRTAKLDSPDRLFDVGTGDRQPDVEVSLTADYVNGRLGARFAGGYNLQLPGNQTRRVTRYDQPLAPKTSLAGVRRDPGDVLRLSAHPFFRLAPYLSLYVGADYWTRGRDVFVYPAAQPPIPGVDIAVLGDGTASDALLLSGGLSYSHAGLNKRGGLGLPMDASFRYERIARSRKGILPDIHSVRIDLRFYTRLLGGGR